LGAAVAHLDLDVVAAGGLQGHRLALVLPELGVGEGLHADLHAAPLGDLDVFELAVVGAEDQRLQGGDLLGHAVGLSGEQDGQEPEPNCGGPETLKVRLAASLSSNGASGSKPVRPASNVQVVARASGQTIWYERGSEEEKSSSRASCSLGS